VNKTITDVGPTTPRGRSYPTRQCGYCPADIPKFNSKGVYYFRSKYNDLATCGSEECQRMAHTNNISAEIKAEAESALDWFIYGARA
jgi:hypothetical protein